MFCVPRARRLRSRARRWPGAVQRADTVRAAPTRRCPRGGGGGGVRGCGARAGRIDPAPQEVGQEGIGSVVGAQRRGARARGGLVRAEARIDTVGVVPTGRADPAIGAAARSETRRVRERVRRVARRPSPGERPARLVGVATRGRGMLRTEVARLDLLHRRATRDSALGTRERLEQPRHRSRGARAAVARPRGGCGVPVSTADRRGGNQGRSTGPFSSQFDQSQNQKRPDERRGWEARARARFHPTCPN